MSARRAAPPPRKLEALHAHGAVHPRPQDVTDPLFHESVFFDAHDLVQVKYEMLRRVRIDEQMVSETAAAFGFSRPSFYTARTAFQRPPGPLMSRSTWNVMISAASAPYIAVAMEPHPSGGGDEVATRMSKPR